MIISFLTGIGKHFIRNTLCNSDNCSSFIFSTFSW